MQSFCAEGHVCPGGVNGEMRSPPRCGGVTGATAGTEATGLCVSVCERVSV